MDEMARVAVEMLIAANRNDTPSLTEPMAHRVLTHELVVRGSTSAPAPAKRKR
jgi:DNA-binding LacI/PurR family transcriptional regulator